MKLTSRWIMKPMKVCVCSLKIGLIQKTHEADEGMCIFSEDIGLIQNTYSSYFIPALQ